MTNAEQFERIFGFYATELWSLPEDQFLRWLNTETHKLDDYIQKSVIEDIKAEIQAIEMEGRVDDRTRFIRGGEEVRNLVLKIIEKNTS